MTFTVLDSRVMLCIWLKFSLLKEWNLISSTVVRALPEGLDQVQAKQLILKPSSRITVFIAFTQPWFKREAVSRTVWFESLIKPQHWVEGGIPSQASTKLLFSFRPFQQVRKHSSNSLFVLVIGSSIYFLRYSKIRSEGTWRAPITEVSRCQLKTVPGRQTGRDDRFRAPHLETASSGARLIFSLWLLPAGLRSRGDDGAWLAMVKKKVFIVINGGEWLHSATSTWYCGTGTVLLRILVKPIMGASFLYPHYSLLHSSFLHKNSVPVPVIIPVLRWIFCGFSGWTAFLHSPLY